MGPPKSMFLTASFKVPVFFDINRYLKDNVLHGLGVPTPNMNLPKNVFLKAKFTN